MKIIEGKRQYKLLSKVERFYRPEPNEKRSIRFKLTQLDLETNEEQITDYGLKNGLELEKKQIGSIFIVDCHKGINGIWFISVT